MKIFLILVLLLLGANKSLALSVEPMEHSISLNAKRLSRTYVIKNASSKPIAFEVKVYKRDLRPNGREIRRSSSDFLIHPKAGKIAANSNQSLRVVYRGKTDLKSEVAYRIIVSQLPVTKSEYVSGKVNIKYLMNFETSMYVSPSNSKPDLLAKNVKISKRGLQFTLVNNGNKHVILKGKSIELVTSKGKKIRVPQTRLSNLNLLAKKGIRVVMARPRARKTVRLGNVEVIAK